VIDTACPPVRSVAAPDGGRYVARAVPLRLRCDTILDAMAAKRKLNLAGLAEVAEVLQVTRRHAIRLTSEPDFPEPIARLRATPVWRRGDVERWAKSRRPNGRRRR
jgi:predicted DNA-binding transcriptional regulator AlpA